VFALIFFSLVVLPSAFGRLGETESECNVRYGVPIKDPMAKAAPLLPGAFERCYRFQGWRITVAFVDGVSARQQYIKSTTPDGPRYIQDYEFKALLEGESGGQSWKAATAPATHNTHNALTTLLTSKIQSCGWVRSDGATAKPNAGPRTTLSVVFDSPKAARLESARKATNDARHRASVPEF
jgi:hypothetical protein